MKQLWYIWSNSRTPTAVLWHWHFSSPFSQQNTGFYYVLIPFVQFLLHQSDWQILRNPHNLIIMLTFSLIILLCFRSQLLAFWGRKYDFCFHLYFGLGRLWEAGCVCLVYNSTIARRKYTHSEERTAGTLSFNIFSKKRMDKVFPPICVFDKYSLSTESTGLWYVH